MLTTEVFGLALLLWTVHRSVPFCFRYFPLFLDPSPLISTLEGVLPVSLQLRLRAL